MRDGVIELVHIGTNDQLADMMTKTQGTKMFADHVRRMFDFDHAITKVKVAKVKCCDCLTCFVTNDVCMQSIVFDPVVAFDPGW